MSKRSIPQAAAGSSPGPPPQVPFLALIAGLPAIGGALLGLMLVVGQGRTLDASLYRKAAAVSFEKKDYASALVCYRRLLAQNADQPETQCLMIVTLEALGQGDKAETLARTLAPEDSLGVAEAHFWLANRILKAPNRLPNEARTAESHLLWYLRVQPDQSEARELLGKLYASMGRFPEARAILEAVNGRHPEQLLRLAHVYEAMGDQDAVRLKAQSARELAEKLVRERPDDRSARVYWANACVTLKDYPGALEVLEKGPASDTVSLNLNMAVVCGAWGMSLEKDGDAKAAERLSVLQRGLRHDPRNQALLGQLGDVMLKKGPASEKARAMLHDQLAKGKASAVLHLVLGFDARDQGRNEEAVNHWELAFELDPKLPLVADNLALLLANRSSADLPRALELIDRAVKTAPKEARLHGSRGLILAKMGRWKEAIPEMETALEAGDDLALHEALAEAYEHLGMSRLAAAHRKRRQP